MVAAISNGESGLSVRTKLNTVIARIPDVGTAQNSFIVSGATPFAWTEMTIANVKALLATKRFDTATDPALNAAATTAIVDANDGVLVTLTGAGNNQTIGDPTTTADIRYFTAINNNTSTHSIIFIANSVNYEIDAGKAKTFVWDGSAWGPLGPGITDIPVTVPQGGTGASTLTDHGILLGSGTDPVTPMAVLATGEIVIGATGADAKALAAQTAASRKFLHQTGTGTAGQDPTWETIISGDLTTALTTPPAIGGSTPAAITGSSITVKSADPQYDLKDSSCADSDVNAQIAAEATATTSGAEMIDLIMRAQLAGVLTELLRYDASDDQWEPAKPFAFGSLDLGTDTGAVTLADKTVTSSAATTDESYMLKIDGNPALTVYAESDGAGGIQKARLVFAYPIAPSNESIQSASEGVAASLTKDVTYITTNGDEDLDNITLADGVLVGQRKEFAVKAVGHANDSVKITPATMVGGTQITFAASPLGLGCHMSWSSAGWVVTANNGGTIA